MRRTLLVMPLLAVSTISCSYDPVPGGSIPSPLVAQVGGTWSGPVTLNSVGGVTAPAGGTLECVGDALKTSLQTDTATMVVSQTGEELSARLTTEHSGQACTYTGSAGPGTLVLNAAKCDAPKIVVRCATGEIRDVILIGTTITASVSNDVATGTLAQTFNVYDAGKPSDSGPAVSGLSTNSTIRMVHR